MSVKIAVRIDDITPDMDWDSFYKFKQLLDEYGVKPLLGVVPDNRDENLRQGTKRDDFWDYLRSLQTEGWSIALHGLKHIYTTKQGGAFPLNHFSEYAGVSYDEQKEMLIQGMHILEKHGIATTVFMAPGHSYDRNTLTILRELGFCYVTDGFGSYPYRDKKSGLIFLPIAFRSHSDILKKHGYTTLVYHINGTSKEQMQQYGAFLKQNRNNFIPYRELLKVTPVERTAIGKIKEKIMANSKYFMVRIRGLIKKS